MEKKQFNSTINANVLKSLKILAVKKDQNINQILEEAIRDLLKKYGQKVEKS